MTFLRLLIILGCAILGSCMGIFFQVRHITGRPQEFRSLATIKLSEKHPIRDDAERRGRNNVIIETLESPEMKRRTWDRVNALNPGLNIGEVAVRAESASENDVFNILATGTEPKATRLFLDALLDEFVAFRITAYSRSDPGPSEEYLQSLTAVMQRATPAAEYVEDWVQPVVVGAGGGGLPGGLLGLMLSLLIVRSPRPTQMPAAA